MLDLILSLVVIAALVFCYRTVQQKISSKALQGLLCMVIGIAIVCAAIYAIMSLIIILVG